MPQVTVVRVEFEDDSTSVFTFAGKLDRQEALAHAATRVNEEISGDEWTGEKLDDACGIEIEVRDVLSTDRVLSAAWRVLLDAEVINMLDNDAMCACALDCWKVLDAADTFLETTQEQSKLGILRAITKQLIEETRQNVRLIAARQCAIYYFG